MYNINSHYENIFHSLKDIIAQRRVMYLYPYGATQPENIETITDNLDEVHKRLWALKKKSSMEDGPLLVFYDQEPLLGEFNYPLFDHINRLRGPHVLITTEKNSAAADHIKEKYGWDVVYYFHHIFAAHDWFRGSEFDFRLVPVSKRKLVKKYITFNRLTSAGRCYRSLLISELVKKDLLGCGYVSYNDICPENNQNYVHNLAAARSQGLITQELFVEAASNISKAPLPLRIDYKDQITIPNHSFVLSAAAESQESFCYVVTETCYWEKKCHLTEKIFKPIVSRMPFLLLAPAHNLKYLQSYGFKTFNQWWDESYDSIEDPVQRLQAVTKVLEDICSRSLDELETMLLEMEPVLEYNYRLFYSQKFLDDAWQELINGIKAVVDPI